MAKIYPQVNVERLLPELPRFFKQGDILGELIANAWRAGAKNVSITLSESILVVTDDGCGVANPELLLTAGATGWNESEIVEPAGLGFFACLQHEAVKQVTVTSGNFTLTMTPDVLKGEPAELSQVEPAVSGTTVRLDLQEHIEFAVSRARGFYPMTVTLGSEVVAPLWHNAAGLIFDLPGLGQVSLHERHICDTPDKSTAIWEHRQVPGAAFECALRAAQREAETSEVFSDIAFVWQVDPASGCRPKLPDRNDLNDDSYLTDAVGKIVGEIYDRLVRLAASSAPPEEKISCYDAPSVIGKAVEWKGRCPDSLGKLLMAIGYRHISFDDLGEIYLYRDSDDGVNIEHTCTSFYVRGAPATRSSVLQESLCNTGHDAAYDPKAPAMDVTIEGLQCSDESPYVAIARRIHVQGIGDVPYLLRTDDSWDTGIEAIDALTNPVIVAADTPEEAVRIVRSEFTLAMATFLYFHDVGDGEDYGDFVDWDDLRIEADRLNKFLAGQVAEAFAPDLGQVANALFVLGDVQSKVQEASWAMRDALRLMKGLGDHRDLARLLRQVESCLKKSGGLLNVELSGLQKILPA